MKELSVQEKAKAYDEAIKYAYYLISERCKEGTEGSFHRSDLQKMFPTLAEGEDERIRKAIIATIHLYYGEPLEDEAKEMISWLERQGEQKVVNNQFTPKQASLLDKHIDKLIEQSPANKYKYEWSGKIKSRKAKGVLKEMLDKKIKSADKVEPKFNFRVGQWIVATGKCVYLIAKIDAFNVTLVDTNGDEYVLDASSLDDAHEWTIQDAKDGDVLYSPSHCLIWIYKDNEHYHASVNLNYANVVSFDNEIVFPSDVCPANRVQKSILFQKMEEAGYEWDVEKKELKKIEQKIAEWSEGDEKVLNAIINTVLIARNSCEEDDEVKDRYDDELRWLKSLKDRYTWKPSDEQITALNYAVNLMASSESLKKNDYYYNVFKDLREQLKKLREE